MITTIKKQWFNYYNTITSSVRTLQHDRRNKMVHYYKQVRQWRSLHSLDMWMVRCPRPRPRPLALALLKVMQHHWSMRWDNKMLRCISCRSVWIIVLRAKLHRMSSFNFIHVVPNPPLLLLSTKLCPPSSFYCSFNIFLDQIKIS
jgi:hypothetical protein